MREFTKRKSSREDRPRSRSGGFGRDKPNRDRFSRDKPSNFRERDRFSKPRQRLEFHKVVCDKCKKTCEVPFKPTSSKPIYCDECFKENKNSNPTNDKLDQINKKLDKILKALKVEL